MVAAAKQRPPFPVRLEQRLVGRMSVLLPCPAPIHDLARLRILEAYIETLKAENESLKRQLADAEKRAMRESARTAASIAEFSAITRRLTARAANRANG